MSELDRAPMPEVLAQLGGLLQQGRVGEAHALCEQARHRPGADLHALDVWRGRIYLRQGRTIEAIKVLEPLLQGLQAGSELLQPTSMALANAWRQLGNAEAERRSLESLLAVQPDAFLAQFRLAQLLEEAGDRDTALRRYFAAIYHAQSQGRWLDDATTAPVMQADVKRAMAFVDQGRLDLFMGVLEPLRQRYGKDALSRVEQGLYMYLGLAPTVYADPRQQPTFFYVPGLPTMPYPDRALFPWLEVLEQQTDAIRSEMLATRAEPDSPYRPFLGQTAEQLPEGLLAGTRGTPAWDAYFLYRHGQALASHHQACPATVAALAQTPLVQIRDHAPEICFSVLTAGSHILPHRGVTNTRLTAHLPLLVPPDCALVAGGETHVWKEGRAMVFDDTFEHEAWNRSDQLRVILLMDTWNPWLRPEEQAAVRDLVEAIGDFALASGTRSGFEVAEPS
ncbi:aspartyl/asparaginyl beta-hydroxylase domain-containing protein [Frateuria aurantia]